MRRTNRSRTGRKPRQGTSLVEVTVAMTIGMVLMGLGVGMIHVLLRAERDISREIRQSLTLSRLAARYRDDVNSADKAEIIEGTDDRPATLVLTSSDRRTISYIAAGAAVKRVVDENGSPQHRDVFRLTPGADVRLHWVDAQTIVRLEIVRPKPHVPADAGEDKPPPTRPDAHLVQLDACVGGNRSSLDVGP